MTLRNRGRNPFGVRGTAFGGAALTGPSIREEFSE